MVGWLVPVACVSPALDDANMILIRCSPSSLLSGTAKMSSSWTKHLTTSSSTSQRTWGCEFLIYYREEGKVDFGMLNYLCADEKRFSTCLRWRGIAATYTLIMKRKYRNKRNHCEDIVVSQPPLMSLFTITQDPEGSTYALASSV